MIIFLFPLVLCLFQRDTRRLGEWASMESVCVCVRECVWVCVCKCVSVWQMCARGEADNISKEWNNW